MTGLLLDTSAYSAIARRHPGIVKLLGSAPLICLSVIVVGELVDGFRGGNRQRINEAELDLFLQGSRAKLLPLDRGTADCYGEIKNSLTRRGRPIPTNDIWIAAGAMQHGLRLVTTDRHFREIPQVIVDYYEPAA